MSAQSKWESGDRVVHASKPEWGTGRVERAESVVQDGKPCQRLTIRFERAGKKTLSTAFATLRSADGKPAIDRAKRQAEPEENPAPKAPRTRAVPTTEAPPESERFTLDPAEAQEIMSAIPDGASDPFRPLADRLTATLNLYRYEPSGRSLLDWAAIQSGLGDPLSVFNRHDLELHFERFRVRLDQHLAALLQACRREKVDPGPILGSASPAAQRALSRINAHR